MSQAWTRAMIRRDRALLTLLLSVLLFSMQLQGKWHAFEHVGEMLRHSVEHSLVVPVYEPCAMCALCAGGANAVACDAADTRASVTDSDIPPCAFVSLAPAVPSYYLSRAPPALL
jgi:hypothetical protein